MINFLFTKTSLLFFIQPLWRDEAFSYLLAKKNVLEIVSLTVKDFNPPFYYLLLHYWIKVFGQSEIAIRSLSLIFYWATVYVCFLFFNRIFRLSFKRSLFYLLLVIVNPLLVYYAFEARMYALFTFLAAASFYFFYRKMPAAYLIATVIGFYTHYFMVFVVLSQLIYLFAVREKNTGARIRPIVICGLIFLPWFIYLLVNKPISQSFWIIKPTLIEAANFLGILFSGHEAEIYFPKTELLKKVVFYLNLILIATVIMAIKMNFSAAKKNKRMFLFLFLWGVGSAFSIGVFSVVKPIYLPRYLIFATVGFLIFLIFVINQFKHGLSFPVILVLIILSLVYNRHQITYRSKLPLDKTVREIKGLAGSKDFVYVTNELDYFTAQYYFYPERVYIFGKTYQEIPDYVGKILIGEDKVVSYLPVYPQKAFIIDQKGLYVINAIY